MNTFFVCNGKTTKKGKIWSLLAYEIYVMDPPNYKVNKTVLSFQAVIFGTDVCDKTSNNRLCYYCYFKSKSVSYLFP